MTAMRAARVVDHVQKTVANPSAAPVGVAGDELHPLALGVGDERAAEGEQGLVARRDLVEVAVGAHQRQQVGEVGLAGDRDRGGASGALTASCRRTGRR